MTDTKHPEATPQNLYQITGNVADMNTVLIERSELRRLQAENAELEAMLDAVGAGGVGESIKPSVIDALRLAESVFRAYGDHHAAKPDEEKAQRNYQLADTMRAALLAAAPEASTQPAVDHFRDATQMVPARQPLTKDQVLDMWLESGKPPTTCIQAYVQGISDTEAAHGITGGQQ